MNPILITILISITVLYVPAIYFFICHMKMFTEYKLDEDPEFDPSTKFDAEEFSQFIRTNLRNGVYFPRLKN